MFFRSLQHRLIRMEGRIEMHLQQMSDVLVEELALIKMEKRSVTTWENTPWALDK